MYFLALLTIQTYFYLVNLLILTKFHIHTCTFTNKTPNLMVLLTEICIYIDSIRDSVNKKSCKNFTIYLFVFIYTCISCFEV